MQKECNTSLKQHAKQKGTTSVCCVVFLFLLCFGFLFHNTTQEVAPRLFGDLAFGVKELRCHVPVKQ